MSAIERNRRESPFQRRMSLAFLVMSLLVFIASGSGLWLSTSTQIGMNTTRAAQGQVERLLGVQRSWMDVTVLIDNGLLSRSTELVEGQLKTRLEDLSQRLASAASQPGGSTPARADENRMIAEDLQQAGAQLSQAVAEMLTTVKEANWTAAENLRFTRIAALQRSMEDGLDRLIYNARADADASIAAASRTQAAARIVLASTAIASLLAGVLLSISLSRSVVIPVRQMVTQVEQISSGDFTPFQPLGKGGEIGALGQALLRMTYWLRETYARLETRVDERTRNLERRSAQIQAASLVARDISAARQVDEVLNRAVTLIVERFGFYHAGIFLIDERSEYAVLRAATGEAGRAMLARGHQLKVGESGIVGFVTGTGQPRIALDVGVDAVHFRNPLLPETRSEMALPLKVSEQMIGALDVQSREPSAFSEDDVTILQIMADQLAVAIENARLLGQVQSQLQALETFYGEYGGQAWEKIGQSSQVMGYRFERGSLTPLSREQAAEGLPGGAPLTIPLEVRGASIGAIQVWPEKDALPEADLELLQAVGERISQALETARLFQEAQERANREQIVNRMTTSLSRSLDLGALLQNALRELARLPQVVEVSVHVGPGQGSPALETLPSTNGGHASSNGGHKAQPA